MWKLPRAALLGLRAAATPRTRLFRAPLDTYPDFLTGHAVELPHFPASGLVLAAVLTYLDQRHGIDLMHCGDAEIDALSAFVSKERGTTTFVLTEAQRSQHLGSLQALRPDDAELAAFFRELNEWDEPSAGPAMAIGFRWFADGLAAVGSADVVLVEIA